MLLFDLEVDPLDASSTTHDLYSAQVGFEVIQHAASLLQETLQSEKSSRLPSNRRLTFLLSTPCVRDLVNNFHGTQPASSSTLHNRPTFLKRHECRDVPGIIGHVLGQVGEQHSDVESDVLGWIVESIRELVEVHLAVLVRVDAHHDVLDLFSAQKETLIALQNFVGFVSSARKLILERFLPRTVYFEINYNIPDLATTMGYAIWRVTFGEMFGSNTNVRNLKFLINERFWGFKVFYGLSCHYLREKVSAKLSTQHKSKTNTMKSLLHTVKMYNLKKLHLLFHKKKSLFFQFLSCRGVLCSSSVFLLLEAYVMSCTWDTSSKCLLRVDFEYFHGVTEFFDGNNTVAICVAFLLYVEQKIRFVETLWQKLTQMLHVFNVFSTWSTTWSHRQQCTLWRNLCLPKLHKEKTLRLTKRQKSIWHRAPSSLCSLKLTRQQRQQNGLGF